MSETNIKKNTTMSSGGESIEKSLSASEQDTNQETNLTGATAPVTPDKPSVTANEASPMPNVQAENAHDEAQPESNAKLAAELQENTQLAVDCLAKGIESGKYLSTIHKKPQRLYQYRIDPKTQKGYIWEDYCTDVLRISVQYANRKIAAWENREMVRPHISPQDFAELPLTTSPWVELGKRPENEQIEVIKGIIAEFRKDGKSLGRLTASDIMDFQINKQDEPSEGDNYDDDEGTVNAGDTDDTSAFDEPVDVAQMANDVRNGKPTDYSRLSPVNREELRTKLEAMLEESREVQNNIETFLKELDSDADQGTDQGTEQDSEQDAGLPGEGETKVSVSHLPQKKETKL